MNQAESIKIGTRASPLALYQATLIRDQLATVSGGALAPEIVTFTTKGDQLTTERLINSGGKGLFTSEIDAAVEDGRVDIAVHSLKDVPSVLPQGQTLLAFPKRADPRDGLLGQSGPIALGDMAPGAVLGTASLRREAQVLNLRPDLKIIPFRGNVQTRLRKLEEGQAAATFLAMAGLERLGLAHLAQPISIEDMLPAACQGIIAVCGKDSAISETLTRALAQIDHAQTRQMATAERAFLAELDGSCRTAMGAHLYQDHDRWKMRAEVLAPDGQQKWAHTESIDLSASNQSLADFGQSVAEAIRANAGGKLPVFEDV